MTGLWFRSRSTTAVVVVSLLSNLAAVRASWADPAPGRHAAPVSSSAGASGSTGSASAGSVTTPSPAQEAKARGDEAMLALNYGIALSAYAEAYAASHDPALLYNQARASQALGDYTKALDFLDRFQTEASADLMSRVPRFASLRADVKHHVALVQLTCNVAGAEVFLDDRPLGKTPLAKPFRANAGTAKIVVRSPGYVPVTHRVNLPGGSITPVDVALHLEDVSGVLLLRSAAGVEVSVDGAPRGPVPVDVPSAPGTHALRFTRDGYQAADTNVLLAAHERKVVDVQLVKLPGVTSKWWFWTSIGAGVLAVGAVTAVILATHERSADTGSIAPGRVSAPLVSF